jgi:hypothetical protein
VVPATYNGPVRIEDAAWYGGPREPRSDYEISVTTSTISLLEGLTVDVSKRDKRVLADRDSA